MIVQADRETPRALHCSRFAARGGATMSDVALSRAVRIGTPRSGHGGRRRSRNVTSTVPRPVVPIAESPSSQAVAGRVRTSVTCEIHLRLLVADDRAEDVPTTVVYSPADPYAVHATMHVASGPVEWVLSRDLLHDGLSLACGVGDLHVAPGTDDHGVAFVSIELSTPHGHAILLADASELSAFLAGTFRAVPLGCESAHIDIDAALASLVAGD